MYKHTKNKTNNKRIKCNFLFSIIPPLRKCSLNCMYIVQCVKYMYFILYTLFYTYTYT